MDACEDFVLIFIIEMQVIEARRIHYSNIRLASEICRNRSLPILFPIAGPCIQMGNTCRIRQSTRVRSHHHKYYLPTQQLLTNMYILIFIDTTTLINSFKRGSYQLIYLFNFTILSFQPLTSSAHLSLKPAPTCHPSQLQGIQLLILFVLYTHSYMSRELPNK